MSERWINAVVEVVMPADVAVDAAAEAKQRAATAALERLELPQDAVASVRWELVEDGEPVEP